MKTAKELLEDLLTSHFYINDDNGQALDWSLREDYTLKDADPVLNQELLTYIKRHELKVT